jgi:tungstate transport system substrate-binding protein
MYNTFEILGPANDPAEIRSLEPSEALQTIAASVDRFVSRGDDSGTHKREIKLWRDGGGRPEWDGYLESGQGMGSTLMMADQMNAYVLCDHGTFLKFKAKVRLVPLVTSSKSLYNAYGIMVVNPDKSSNINRELADTFVDFIISPTVQNLIRDYEIGGEKLFHPLRLADES